MSDNEILKTLSDAQSFFRQERSLYGDRIYREEPSAEHFIDTTAEQANTMGVKKSSTRTVDRDPVLFTDEPKQPAEPWQSAEDLSLLNKMICNCLKCSLGKTRTKFVFGVGNPNADILVIGEAPGADEDAQGEPFVGRAGQLLNKILESVQFKREEVFIANILKCRPPQNRKPTPEETELCEPYLWKQIELIKPKIILCLGLTAAQTLLRTTESMGQLRQSTHLYRNTPVIVTYHPAALLRNPNWKRPTWEDVQKLKKMYEEQLRIDNRST